ncbi:DUF1648 domain-containing protein [Oceanobacillus alkalisoli]|uniref:DUF1648 domain-containing protein n=1 Tax=Oceanobacillus alkalisoli TaxID=2925113 RepID=UPI001EE475CB|nr:DUF5808 domain-containing protein [Oceanobacillus alkalisoli]MCG5104983.1 DUF5808 domain-containing protein [Oceanobacillus alkalisoli]
MNEFLFPIIVLTIFIPVVLTITFIPYWTRRTESFGVTIPQKIYPSDELKKMRKQYAGYTSIFALLLLIVLFILSRDTSEQELGIQLTIITLLYLTASFLIYLKFHFQMKKLKEKRNWNEGKSERLFISTNFHQDKLRYSNLWFLISFFITFIVIFFTFKNYHLLPERIPMQYDFSGEVTSWADKSYRSALLFPVLMLYMTLIFLFVNTIISRAKQQIDSEDPEKSLKQNAMFRRRWSLFTIIGGISLTSLFAFAQASLFFNFSPAVFMIITLGFTVLFIGGSIYLSFTTGQGGSRIKHGTMSKDGKTINRDDDKYWKLGVIYFNRNDPALFLEKRFGVGWTINLARPLAWMTLLLIIGFAMLIPLLFS